MTPPSAPHRHHMYIDYVSYTYCTGNVSYTYTNYDRIISFIENCCCLVWCDVCDTKLERVTRKPKSSWGPLTAFVLCPARCVRGWARGIGLSGPGFDLER